MDVKRRDFIKSAALVAGSVPMFSMANYLPLFDGVRNNEIVIYNTKWGFEGSMEEFCRKSAKAGYDGIEVWTPQDAKDRENLIAVAKDHGLKLALLAGNSGKTVDENLTSFKAAVSNAISCQPTFINCHSGKDYYTFGDNRSFVEHTIAKEIDSGIPIYHETHRGRILFNAPIAKRFLERFDDLRLTLDISHWTVVHESLLQDQPEAVNLALERTGHIHSRVGFQEAPQIPDPSSEHYESAIKTHFAWWDTVVKKHAENGKTLTMTTEFGPPPYMWTSPETGEPLKKVWDMNVMMMKMWKKRYA